MICKIKKIDNFGIFKAFDWESALRDGSGHARNFQPINIIYGRNYSGKTTLSRIIRALETGEISDKFENPSFSVELVDGTLITQTTLTGHNKKVRVFNEDFVRANLRFMSNPDDSIEPFAILGDENNKIEQEIAVIEEELGSNELENQTGLYGKRATTKADYTKASTEHKTAENALEKQLADKATDRTIGIKYKSDRFGDQNYTIQKLKNDIVEVQNENYQLPTEKQLAEYENLILETVLKSVPEFKVPNLNFQSLSIAAEALVTKKINQSDKIQELVQDAILNRWVNEGRTHHKDKHSKCAFCDNSISENRWKELEKHFDEESEQLEKDIDELINKIAAESNRVRSVLSIEKHLFYSKFHDQLDELDITLRSAVSKYQESLNKLVSQLESRKKDILNQKLFEKPVDTSNDLLTAWSLYEPICTESNNFTTSLNTEQTKAKKSLRLKEISDYIITIGYENQLSSIKQLKDKRDDAEQEKNRIDGEIMQKEKLIASKKRELKDEENGAKKVNEYLNNFFGHRFLTLEAKKDDTASGEELKQIRFEVIRDGKKAYHLSEGECSLLAFCYFLARLDDTNTKNSKPIIWIDDPISSLDGNHIFFVYSLLETEIVSSGKFEQLFVSTHNLNFLKYLNQLQGSFLDEAGKSKHYQKDYFVVVKNDKKASIAPMPKYLKEYVTEFNYLFHQIYKCAAIETVDDSNYTTFFNFANNARKFFEIYLYYKYPEQGGAIDKLQLFFGEERIPAVLTDRINNEYSHLCGVFERGETPVEVPEMQTAAKQIIRRLQEKDRDQYNSLLKSIGEPIVTETIQ